METEDWMTSDGTGRQMLVMAAATEMLELLKELDEDRPVVGGEYGPITCCPICLFPKAYGHFPDCKLGNLLARLDS
jgi:hypothetical protein